MTDTLITCRRCHRKVTQSISNRCLYCGAALAEEHHLDEKGRAELLARKMEQFKQNEENAEDIISGMRRDFGLPGKKSRKSRKQDNAAAVAAALTSANTHINGNGGGSGPSGK